MTGWAVAHPQDTKQEKRDGYQRTGGEVYAQNINGY